MVSRKLLSGLMVVMMCIGTAAWSVAQNDSSNRDHDIETLLVQRRDVLRERVAAAEAAYNVGNGDIKSLSAAQHDLLHAELELCTEPTERVELRSSLVVNRKRTEEIISQQFATGSSTREDLLWATAERLQAEIDLLREHQR